MKLEKQIAIVTGGGRGIGKSIALALAREGADLCVTARTNSEIEQVAEEVRSLGRRCLARCCDVRDAVAVKEMVDAVDGEFGSIDILVNNAGGSFVRSAVVDGLTEDWSRVIETNLLGLYYCTHAVLPHMIRAGRGKIINVGSGMGHSARAGNSAYNTAKAGVWMFTRCLAMEVWKHGIDVNELIPGPVLTELTKDVFDLDKPPPMADSERVKTPEECVPLALFLATHPPGGPTGQSFSLARRPL